MTLAFERTKEGIVKIEKYLKKKNLPPYEELIFLKQYIENVPYNYYHDDDSDVNYQKLLKIFLQNPQALEQILDFIEGGLQSLFTKQSREFVLEILEEEEFKTLGKYLKECHNCLSKGLNFAGAVCFRTCLEIVISSFNQGRNLEKKIENFFKQIEEIATFQNVIAFKDSLNNLFTTIREAGNDVAHFKKDIEVIEQNLENMEETFATFCFILEKTLFKDKIQQKREEAERKELEEKLVNKNKPEESFENEPEVSIDKNFTSIDDDIPF